ncbi:MAG: acyltransferase [Armatimonadetes bacterium]|nr:acyltransferase [Armatimonadota bacterium]
MNQVVAKGQRWQFLDAIRGIAALAVVLQHSLWFASPHLETFFATLWSPGRFGVVAFFIVSGFIVPRSLELKGDVKGFWISRFWRLFPAYWFSLFAFAFLAAIGVETYTQANLHSPIHWIANLSMMHGLIRIPDINPVSWTLGLEMVLYGAITIAFVRGFIHRTWAISLSILGLIVVSSVLFPMFLHIRFPAGASAVFGSILAGLALYRWFSGSASRRDAIAITFLCMAVTVGSSIINYSPVRVSGDPLQPTQFCAISSVITGYAFFLAFLAMKDRSFPNAFLWLGKISYSLYLLHPLALVIIPAGGNPFVTVPSQVGLSILLAWLGYRFVEVPSLEIGKRSLAKRNAPQAEPERDVVKAVA